MDNFTFPNTQIWIKVSGKWYPCIYLGFDREFQAHLIKMNEAGRSINVALSQLSLVKPSEAEQEQGKTANQ